MRNWYRKVEGIGQQWQKLFPVPLEKYREFGSGDKCSLLLRQQCAYSYSKSTKGQSIWESNTLSTVVNGQAFHSITWQPPSRVHPFCNMGKRWAALLIDIMEQSPILSIILCLDVFRQQKEIWYIYVYVCILLTKCISHIIMLELFVYKWCHLRHVLISWTIVTQSQT